MQSRCVLVLGMHRGGTSAFAGTLRTLGVDFGDDLLPGQVENPLGFFEDRTVVRVNDDILDAVGSFWCDLLPDLDPADWERHTQELLDEATLKLGVGFGHASLWGLKDPRLCRLLPLWLPLLVRLESTPCCVITVRHPLEVAASLVARNRMEPKNAQLLWLEHLLAAEVNTRGLRRVFVTYDGLMNDWRGTVAGIAAALEIDWPHPPGDPVVADQVDRFLQPALRHHRHDDTAGALRPAHEVYALFCRLATLPAGSAEAEETLAALDERRRLAREWSWQHTEENVRLRCERHQAQTIIESYEADIKGLRADRTSVVADRARAQEIIETYGAELSRTRHDVEAVLQDRRRAQTVIDENQAELALLRSDRAALATDRRKAQGILEEYGAEITRLRGERETLVADRRQAQTLFDDQASEIKELRADRRQAQTVLDEQASEVQRLQSDRALVVADRQEAQRILEEYGAEIDRLRDEREFLVADRRQAQCVLEDFDAALKAVRAEQEALAGEHRQTQQALRAGAGEIEALRQERATLQEECRQAQATITTQADELKALHAEAQILQESPRRALAAAVGATRRYLKLESAR